MDGPLKKEALKTLQDQLRMNILTTTLKAYANDYAETYSEAYEEAMRRRNITGNLHLLEVEAPGVRTIECSRCRKKVVESRYTTHRMNCGGRGRKCHIEAQKRINNIYTKTDKELPRRQKSTKKNIKKIDKDIVESIVGDK